MNHFFRFCLITMLSCFFVTAYADELDDRSLEHNQVYHITDDIDLVSTIKIQYDKPKVVVKSVYPLLEGNMDEPGVEAFNDLVTSIVKSEIEEFKKRIADVQELQQHLPKAVLKNNLYIDYNASIVKTNDSRIISIRFTIQGIVGGMAHPYHYHRSLNFDLDTAEQIDLADLFLPNADYLGELSSFSKTALGRRLTDKELIQQGTAPIPANFQVWNIKSNGLLLTFEEAQVAPYVNGAQTVLVPYSVLKHIISPDSILGDCTKNKKRCVRSTLLTGGFIDEAVNTKHRALNPLLSKL